jgi:hypothetical protein
MGEFGPEFIIKGPMLPLQLSEMRCLRHAPTPPVVMPTTEVSHNLRRLQVESRLVMNRLEPVDNARASALTMKLGGRLEPWSPMRILGLAACGIR